MKFKDIFTKSFLSGFSAADMDTTTILTSLCITLVIGLYIFFVYRMVTKKTFYSETFNLSLIGMAVITAAIILTIQSNIVLSLGMVGALSIVRFRTAVKDPLDLVFLYWAISIGIICGEGLSEIAVIVSLLITIVILIMQKYPKRKLSMLLVVNSSDVDNDCKVMEVVKQYSKYNKIKSRNLTSSSLDMIVEVQVEAESKLMHDVMQIEGVTSAALLSHDGEITG